MSDSNQQIKRTRRSSADVQKERELKVANKPASMGTESESRTPDRGGRQEIRQRVQKPLKLDVANVQKALEEKLSKSVKLKWCRHTAVDFHLQIGWEVVSTDLKTAVNKYTPDGRLKSKSDNIQDDSGGAYTSDVGGGETNFLMYKDLAAYEAEDATWNKQDADAPMDAIHSAQEMGERAGLGGDVKTYQPSQQVKITKQREAY